MKAPSIELCCYMLPPPPAPPAFHVVAHGADAAHNGSVQGCVSVKHKGALRGVIGAWSFDQCSRCACQRPTAAGKTHHKAGQ